MADFTEFQQMVLDEVMQQEQQPLPGRLINVPVARSEDNSMFRERNTNVMMPRGKAPIEKAKSGKKTLVTSESQRKYCSRGYQGTGYWDQSSGTEKAVVAEG